MTDRQFWWVRARHEDGTPGKLQLAEVEFEGGAPRQANFMNTCASLMPEDIDTLTLIERVLPAGRVTAAGLRDALDASSRNGGGFLCRFQDDDDEGKPTGPSFTVIDGYFDLERAAAILQGGENRA